MTSVARKLSDGEARVLLVRSMLYLSKSNHNKKMYIVIVILT